jgi:hypothetical protein
MFQNTVIFIGKAVITSNLKNPFQLITAIETAMLQ